MTQHGDAERAIERLVTQQAFFVHGFYLVAERLVVGKFESRGDSSPFVLVGDAVVAAELFHGFEKAVEVDVFVVDRGAFIEGRTGVVHEFVQLRHEVVFFFERFIAGAL